MKLSEFGNFGGILEEMLEAAVAECNDVAMTEAEGNLPGFMSGAIACANRLKAEIVRRKLLTEDSLKQPMMSGAGGYYSYHHEFLRLARSGVCANEPSGPGPGGVETTCLPASRIQLK
jgi:hypothetical protein